MEAPVVLFGFFVCPAFCLYPCWSAIPRENIYVHVAESRPLPRLPVSLWSRRVTGKTSRYFHPSLCGELSGGRRQTRGSERETCLRPRPRSRGRARTLSGPEASGRGRRGNTPWKEQPGIKATTGGTREGHSHLTLSLLISGKPIV